MSAERETGHTPSSKRLVGDPSGVRIQRVASNVTQQDTISHIAMLPEESVRINSDYEFWLAERILHDLNK